MRGPTAKTYLTAVGAGVGLSVFVAIAGVLLILVPAGFTYAGSAVEFGARFAVVLALGGVLSAVVATSTARRLAREMGSVSRRPAFLGATAGVGAAAVPGLLLPGSLGLVGAGILVLLSLLGAGAYYAILRRLLAST